MRLNSTQLARVLRELAVDPVLISVLGVDYLHIHLPDGDDLYLTEFGVPFAGNLLPECLWTDEEWRQKNSTALSGTSSVYRVRTKPAFGHQRDVVLKWNRMGQDIPGADDDENMLVAEFNSPFEEFALVLELRNTTEGETRHIRTHRPLAIYVPAKAIELWRVGRKEHQMQEIVRRHQEIQLDMFRRYAVVYEWIKGIDAAEACRNGLLTEQEMGALTLSKEMEMQRKGYLVHDRKPHHIIVRPQRNGTLLRNRDGKIAYGAVDFELLQRTPEWEAETKRRRRKAYLNGQVHRFDEEVKPLPDHLVAVNVLGVDYIFGNAESTGGALWVVGRDPELFDYFLPERWQHAPRTRLSNRHEVYETVSKDDIRLVWKVSRVGQIPDTDPFRPDEQRIMEYGYNSPFQDFALSQDLTCKGMPTTFPRAIYMTGHESSISGHLLDRSRYERHAALLMPDGTPVLRQDRDYVSIWGYWNKPDKSLAETDTDHYRPIDALRALREGKLDRDLYLCLMQRLKQKLAAMGYEDLDFGGTHKLLALDKTGEFLSDDDGLPRARICSFELLRKM